MYDDLLSNLHSLERLQALIRLRDAGSLIAAAGGDSGEQSRMSHRLGELSKFMGTELTMRDGRALKLSPAGASLAEIASEYFFRVRAFRNQASKAVVPYCVAAGDSVMQWLVVPASRCCPRGGT